MSDAEILVEFWKEEWVVARHFDEQRTTISNLIIIVAAAIIGFIIQVGISMKTLPMTIFLIVLGLYGTITVKKLYERHQYHIIRMRKFRERIDELVSDAKLMEIVNTSKDMHREHYPRLSKQRLHYLWSFLHISITIMGIITTIMSILN